MIHRPMAGIYAVLASACLGIGGSSLAMAAGHAPRQPGAIAAWITSGDGRSLLAPGQGARWQAQRAATLAATVIEVDPGQRFQPITGLGAAITDASAFLIQERLDARSRTALLRELFGRADGGLGLSFTRLTIGASDFSPTHYSLDDMPPGQSDPRLTAFSIGPNRTAVLPVVKAALAINPALKVMASPWSAPGWMKTSDSLVTGSLKPEAYPAFADYLNRYVEAYRAEGVPIFALTLQNEPHFEPRDYPGMRVDPAARAAFIGGHLGPLLARRNPATRLFDWDHNWNEPESPAAVLADPIAARHVAGVAWHCYGGDVRVQSALRDAHPDKEVWFTECSGGQWAPDFGENLMYFTRTLVIGTTRNWARGVLLWNLALDERHGPSNGGCRDCRGVVTIDSSNGAITRNVEYYALAHASRFVLPGAQRVASTSGHDGIDTVAFRNPDGSLALLVANANGAGKTFSVRAGSQAFSYRLPPRSVATFTWQGDRRRR